MICQNHPKMDCQDIAIPTTRYYNKVGMSDGVLTSCFCDALIHDTSTHVIAASSQQLSSTCRPHFHPAHKYTHQKMLAGQYRGSKVPTGQRRGLKMLPGQHRGQEMLARHLAALDFRVYE
eukprot:GHUV01023169.1.p2 GENE.GHUV01023169.1~~GHUV01023169.1.p2  ORF type:complete len:120 (+),score=17.27 GHUV01023169.1:1051-1410(+)